MSEAASCAALSALGCAGRRMRKAWLRARRAQDEEEKAKALRLERCVEMMHTLYHPVVFIRFSAFRAKGAFIAHEELLAAGALHHCHTHTELEAFTQQHPTVFFSHQWLGFTAPDPAGLHFATVCSACEFLLQRDAIGAEELFLWVDYSSIPQACKFTQTLSISSLAAYASALRYFVIIAPETTHHGTQKPCNYGSYSRRGWCRLEQWARLASEGTRDLFKWTGEELELAFDEEHERQAMVDSLMVCEGDFTVRGDIHKLVDTVLGLWAMCVARQDCDETVADVKAQIDRLHERVFPSEFFDDLPERMVAMLEENPETKNRLKNPNQQRPTTLAREKTIDLQEHQHRAAGNGNGSNAPGVRELQATPSNLRSALAQGEAVVGEAVAAQQIELQAQEVQVLEDESDEVAGHNVILPRVHEHGLEVEVKAKHKEPRLVTAV